MLANNFSNANWFSYYFDFLKITHSKFGNPSFKLAALQLFCYLAAGFLSHFSLESFFLDVLFMTSHMTLSSATPCSMPTKTNNFESYLDQIHALVRFLCQNNFSSLRDDDKRCPRQADGSVNNSIAVGVFCNHFANTLKSKNRFMGY